MVEGAIAIPVLLAFLFFTMGFSANAYQYLRISNALRMASRIASMQTTPLLGGAGGCAALVSNIFSTQLGQIGLSQAPVVETEIEQSGLVRGLVVEVSADLDLYVLPDQMAPISFRTRAFVPLEDQTACQ